MPMARTAPDANPALSRRCMPIEHIVRTTGHSRELPSAVSRRLPLEGFQARRSSSETHLPVT